MINATFYEIGSSRRLGVIPMDCPPARGDFVVLPDEGEREWIVDVRRFRPRAGALSWRNEEVELWVSLAP